MLKKVLIIVLVFLVFIPETIAQEGKEFKHYFPIIIKEGKEFKHYFPIIGKCKMAAILEITDGTTTIDFLATDSGIFLENWIPAVAQLKGGGTYQDSDIAPESQLIHGVFENTTETFDFTISNRDQDALIRKLQTLLRLLQKARAYWTTEHQDTPVYIVAKSYCETNTRYAIIKNYKFSDINNPYAQPFFSASKLATMASLSLSLERGHWLSNPPDRDWETI